MKKISCYLVVSFVILFITGCKEKTQRYEQFDFNYSLESIGAYTIDVNINSNKTYKITQNNLFMNRVQDDKPVYTYTGTLDEKSFKKIEDLISKANLLSMKDSYGFNDDPDANNKSDLLIQIKLKTPDQEKFVSIRDDNQNKFDKSFLELINYLNGFITDHVNK